MYSDSVSSALTFSSIFLTAVSKSLMACLSLSSLSLVPPCVHDRNTQRRNCVCSVWVLFYWSELSSKAMCWFTFRAATALPVEQFVPLVHNITVTHLWLMSQQGTQYPWSLLRLHSSKILVCMNFTCRSFAWYQNNSSVENSCRWPIRNY